MDFDYFYNREAERFNFLKVPEILVDGEEFKGLSAEAIILYSMLLKRTGMSFKNNWIDKEGRVFIYFTVEEIMKRRNISKPTAIKTLDELDSKKGIGLIERVRLGLGKPNVIYRIEDMINDNHKDFVKAIISMEKGINDESALDKLYDAYMDNDTINLLHEEFDYMIEDLKEQGQIKDLPYVQEEKDNLINIVGNIVGNVDVVERENKNGEAFKVANFSVVSKDDEGNKVYNNCSAYGEKSDIPKDFKQGDFVKLFGQIRTSIDDNGKEHSNVRILSSKLLKAREQMKGQEEKKESVLGAIKKYQAEDKEKPKEKKEANREAER